MSIDKQTFNKLKERMKDKFPTLLERYLQDAKVYLVTIEVNLTSGVLEQAIEAVHSLKSASGLLGVMEVHQLAEKLEYAAKEVNEAGTSRERLVPLYEDLRQAFSAVESELRHELEKARAA